MKVPVSWLKAYVDFDDSVQGLADKLTFSGVEVEGIETIGGAFAGIVVGEVLQVSPHPHADRLTLCSVTAGDGEVQVVCGAPNVAAGLKVPFAPVGAVLPDGTKLKRAKIRQMESFGMLLAEDELGISDDHSGLMVLDPAWAPGTPLAEVLGPPETILDLEITPNRPDCLSLIGIAREVAALYGTALKWPAVELEESGPAVETLTQVQVDAPQDCPRYTARVLQGVRIAPSPDWMQRRLSAAGIRPINNVVDITNYVMLECGHPLHAFDQALLAEGRVQVRHARAGERMHTLDGIERELTPEMLVIADATRPVALAGIMGGAGSEIRAETETVLLESACFAPLQTRTTAAQLALSTESSYRFERGVDAATVEWASRRAAALMAAHCGARIAAGVMDLSSGPSPVREIACAWDFVRTLTGMAIGNEAIERILVSLGLTMIQTDGDGFTVAVPSFRSDLERPVDLVEEVARIHGLDQIPTPAPLARIVPGADYSAQRAITQLKSNLAGLGLREIMNYSLTAPALLERFGVKDLSECIVLPHPISEEQSVLRPSLIPQMAETLARNHARQIPEVLFFEAGRVYRRAGDGYAEEERIAVGLMGPVGRSAMDKRRAVQPAEMFAWLKGVLDSLLCAQGFRQWSWTRTPHSYLAEGQALALQVAGGEAGFMGLLRESIRRPWRLTEPVAVAEMSTRALIAAFDQPIRAQAVSVYPAIVRDMALIVEVGVAHETLLDIIHSAAGEELEKVELFDIFEGDAIGPGLKSMAYSVTYRSGSKTLTDGDANAYHERVKNEIRRVLENVTIREG
jgi:phenylalanyl-tRNA synthetase beta chain